MLEGISEHISNDGFKILLVLFLSFIIGLEREEKKARGTQYFFGGVVTFPLIGLLGYGAAVVSKVNAFPLAIGLAVVGGFLLIAYRHKISTSEFSGFSNEISGLMTYLLGALVYFEHYWIATTLLVITLLILELKKALETLTTRIPAGEMITFAKFLFLTAVILPIVPNQNFTEFGINPFKIWLIVIAVSTISYISYILQRLMKGRGGVLFSGFLGGIYSSTATTVVLSKRSRTHRQPNLYAGSILIACGVMYLRVLILLFLFNAALFYSVLVPFLSLAAFAGLGGWLLARSFRLKTTPTKEETPLKNPLELWAAFLFAGIFVVVLALTHLSINFIGNKGIYLIAFFVGGIDVDPFLMGLTQTAGREVAYSQAIPAIFIAASANNLIKGIYATIFSNRKTGLRILLVLVGLALVGLLPIIYYL